MYCTEATGLEYTEAGRLHQWTDGPIAVTVWPGEYRATENLELTEQESRMPESPVVYWLSMEPRTPFQTYARKRPGVCA